MKKIGILAAMAVAALTAVAQSWPNVNAEMKPGTRWWWLGSAVDSVNIAWNIEQYGAAGLGSVEITPIYGVQGNESNDIQFLSPEWMQALQDVETAAEAQGMLVDMNQGTGWPFGGPEVPVEQAACKVVFLIDTVPAGEEQLKVLPAKETSKLIPSLIAVNRRSLDDGRVEVIRAYQSRTLQAVKRAAPGGEGLVIDHFDRDAVKAYLGKFDKAFSEHGTPYPHNFFNDSYEVYGANWTPTLFAEFEARRGYPLHEHLAELIGTVDDGNKVLSDYRETLGELLLENFTNQWAQWAHERGVKVRNQAHGSPANLIDVYAAVDVPEIEGFGLSEFGIQGLRTDHGYTRKNDSDVSMLKYASSAAHIAGKPLTSSETFTWLTEHFRTSLAQMKPDLDLMFCCGVNHMFFHGTTYTPQQAAWPGWRFYASVDMSPNNTIWADAPALMEYITRAQSMLQSGRPDNDFLVYLPVRDMWAQRLQPGEGGLLMAFSIHNMGKLAPDFIASVMEIDSLGYDCDYISDAYLMGTTYADGRLRTAAGTPYRGLIIPGSGRLTSQLKAHIDSLQAQGANVIYGIDPSAMAAAAQPEKLRTDLGLRAIRRAEADGYTYFIANLSDRDVESRMPLTVDFADAYWMDPMDGDIYRAAFDGQEVEFDLRSGESRFLRTYNQALTAEAAPKTLLTEVVEEIDLAPGTWQLTFDQGIPARKLDRLQYWTELGDSVLNEYAGTGTYTTTFKFNPKKHKADLWSLDLNGLRESARVYLNDAYIGTVWAAPLTIDIPATALRKGNNTLRLEVTNLPANRIAAMDRNGQQWRIFKEINVVDINYKKTGYGHWPTLPSGASTALLRAHRHK